MKLRAAILAFVAIAVLAAGVLPPCGDAGCCALEEKASLHRAMPCCDEPSVASSEPVRLLAATSALPQVALPAAVIEPPAAWIVPRVQATLATAASAHAEADPPLFLLNEQFLI